MPSHRSRSRRGDSAASATESAPEIVVTRGDGAELEIDLFGGFVSQVELDGLARLAAEANARRARALARLSQHLTQLEEQTVERSRSSSAAVLRKISHGDDKLQKRLEQAKTDHTTARAAAFDKAERAARRADERRLWHNATIVSAVPLFTLYGRRNLGNNLTLAALVLAFVLGDKISDFFSGSQEPDERSRWWLYISPLANWLAAWWLLGDQQGERFVTGITSDFKLVGVQWQERAPDHFPRLASVLSEALGIRRRRRRPRKRIERYEATIDLSGYVAPDFVQDLALLSNPPALAALVSVEHGPGSERAQLEPISAQVRDGKLVLQLRVHAPRRAPGAKRGLLRAVQVAWLVDVLRQS
jgi:hypothetical protein